MQSKKIYRHKLSNGLNILTVPSHRTPKVSVQLWYNVGSKDECSGQQGIAHLIEHMIFKGTERLSESDINQITHKLSGSCNAFTAHDYTGYLFDFPTHNWHEALPIMADCMQNCTFRDDYLRSELKAVVQELKMYRDDYVSSVLERMMSTIFADHPYANPVIGYKQDLWNVQRETLLEFYHRHYIPNNATLVVVGDVEPDDVVERAQAAFGAIPPNFDYKKHQFYHGDNFETSMLRLLRNVQQPEGVVVWEVPGIRARKDYLLDLSSWILGAGKSSRLYRVIVEEEQLAADLDSFVYDLFDYGLFVVHFEPNPGISSEQVAAAITAEVARVAQVGFSPAELARAERKAVMDFVALEEQHQQYAYLIGKYFTALQDETYCIEYMEQVPQKELSGAVHELIAQYLRPSVVHYGFIDPVPAQEQQYWLTYQEHSDKEDERILSGITREIPVETGVYVNSIPVHEPKYFDFAQPKKYQLPNGLTVLYHHDASLPTIDVVLELQYKHYYDPEEKLGLGLFLSDCLQEGTKHRSAVAFSDELEGYGMSLHVVPGLISLKMLSQDVAIGFDLMADLLQHATLPHDAIEKVRQRLLVDIHSFWDAPKKCAAQLMRAAVYQNHPYHRIAVGTVDSIQHITRADIIAARDAWITPYNATVAIVGNLNDCDIESIVNNTLGSWMGPELQEPDYPEIIVAQNPATITHYLQRDQIVLAFGRSSVSRYDKDFDALLLFDQIFTGGVLGSMSSRLFELRERSGLFYTIGGSLVAGVGKQPGMVYIVTIVSADRLQEAEEQIKRVIAEGAQSLTQIELDEACRALDASIIDLFATNRQMAGAFLFAHEYGFPDTFFAERSSQLRSITCEDVRQAVARLLHVDTLVKVLVGRV